MSEQQEQVIRKVTVCLRCVETPYGNLSFSIPHHISEKMNENGKFLITIEEIKDFSFSRGRVVIIPL
jgi:hypothetical protein